LGGSHTISVAVSIIYAGLILFLLYAPIKNDSYMPIYYYMCFLVFISIVNVTNYHLMNRLFLPASIVVVFLPFLITGKSKNILYARILVFLSVLPTVRLLYMMITGSFLPA